ncbi:pantoate--beta-alanine ligase [Deinococcus radiodurans]|uniref:Pantothenate synthetase n=1 Tax=Deinococcus radiodurans (strain ATCC 13939 / DSM 20539 / JCM 16871 / CCUG 27074 / LMG 4051 / NBRC 15346 / NCIMB 9279 / VKM B-1422 / R1) TaxID=243230 RepID=PANC_DEIRA|nr:pantoate--beta-alanine ligase [Deinococcus radiodurans]Q9RV66.1 RecName: Full=Pantothenate synthetase; Short=PS; AltName: Full=Pantoate--beta-alanine ligase; AltName: Full=Pantoate-activating enzyme [Deinococcus radiodurans R1 = ATCC 13939 = DSM 20539]AAF10737.1 pantoate--beta-alanine ligase [Deinococcus radiodurans R1 = ATCC 13939 = DSM 20539]
MQTALASRGRVGLVPTMGFLHEGHATLIRRARAECDVVVVSIFVNPMQFGPTEDLATYPRDLDRDLALAGAAGADFVFHPEAAAMYPAGFSTRVEVSGVSEPLDGAARPGHFAGVATVVLKLLNIVQPERAYFGEKDWQQLAVVRRLVADLNLRSEIVGVPTVRADEEAAHAGLALSSRNSYLSPEQQRRATVLSRALRAVQAAYAGGERDTGRLRQAGLDVLASEPELALDYLVVVGPDLRDVPQLSDDPLNRVLIAGRLFGVRLIDNMPLSTAPVPAPA